MEQKTEQYQRYLEAKNWFIQEINRTESFMNVNSISETRKEFLRGMLYGYQDGLSWLEYIHPSDL